VRESPKIEIGRLVILKEDYPLGQPGFVIKKGAIGTVTEVDALPPEGCGLVSVEFNIVVFLSYVICVNEHSLRSLCRVLV
jgi:hypothetical protein